MWSMGIVLAASWVEGLRLRMTLRGSPAGVPMAPLAMLLKLWCGPGSALERRWPHECRAPLGFARVILPATNDDVLGS